MSNGEKYTNPPDYNYFWFIFIIVLFCGYGFGALIYGLEGSILALLGGIFLGTLSILIIWNREFIARPREIEVIDQGIILYLRYGRKSRLIHWDEIICSTGFDFDSSFFFKPSGLGIIALWDKFYYVNRPISKAVADKYYAKTGRKLLEWKKGEDFKSFKRRARSYYAHH